MHALLPYLVNPYFISSHAEVKLQCSQQNSEIKFVLQVCEYDSRADLLYETAKKVPGQLLVCGIGDL